MEKRFKGPIQDEDLAKMRIGNYADAEKALQDKWVYIVRHFLPVVCQEAKKGMAMQVISAYATHEEEALLMWYIDVYSSRWLSEDDEDVLRGGKTKRGKRRGEKSKAKVERKKYEGYVETVRENRTEGTGWDEAVMEKLKEEAEDEDGEGAGTAAAARPAKKAKTAKPPTPLKVRYMFGEKGEVVDKTAAV